MYKIAKMTGLKYERLAVQILKRKSNAGYIVYNGEEYKGKHEPIISEETYDNAMRMMKERAAKKYTDSEYLLSGLVYCGRCGAKMRYQKWGKRGCKLCCYSQEKNKPYLVKNENCDNEKLWADEVEDAVVNELLNLSYEIGKSQEPETNIKSVLEKNMLQCEKKLKRLYELYADDDSDALIEAISNAKAELKKAQKALDDEMLKNTEKRNREEKRKKLEGLSDTWQFMTAKEKRNIVRSLVKKVIAETDCIKIEFNI